LILNSHNIYLDVALEQSLIGLLAFCLIYFGTIGLVVTVGWKNPGALLIWALLAGLVVAVLHGLVDNVLYGPNDAPFLFLLPGIACAMTQSGSQERPGGLDIRRLLTNSQSRRSLIWVTITFIIALLLLANGYRKPLLGAWYANLGSIHMAQVDLADFPSNKWDEGQNLAKLGEAKNLFLNAIKFNPQNRTANHRLGLIAIMEKDFQTGVTYLESAYQSDTKHRGILKALGYCYVWAGQIDQSINFLKAIPEATQELGTYSWWWRTQGRNDLAEQAETAANLLKSSTP
jgi:tetratricopeptide (TPR) repeat protein